MGVDNSLIIEGLDEIYTVVDIVSP